MATSDNHGLQQRPESSPEYFGSLSRYDLLLAVIPTILLVGLLAGQLLPIGTVPTLAGAGIVAALAVVDALFVHPPTDPR